MIGFLQGKVIHFEADNVLLLVNQVGYEILLPATVVETVQHKPSDEFIDLFIYYHQTDRQPKPVLIGFDSQEQKDFFQLFISVDAIGPLKAAKAMEHPVSTIAKAIEEKDVAFLATLRGIGRRTAQKIVAALQGKAGHFVSETAAVAAGNGGAESGTHSLSIQKCIDQVVAVLVQQLGHTPGAAKQMVAQALERDPSIMTPEALFDEVYKGGLD